jgi:hypothetical protein
MSFLLSSACCLKAWSIAKLKWRQARIKEELWRASRMIQTNGWQVLRKKHSPVLLYPTKIPHNLAWNPTQSSALRNRRLIAWATEWLYSCFYSAIPTNARQCTNLGASCIIPFILSYLRIIPPLEATQSELLTHSFNVQHHYHHHHHHYHHYHHVVCLTTGPKPPTSDISTECDLVPHFSVYSTACLP